MNSALQNCGNTCYINPALQILFQILFIEAFFENPKEECSELGQCLKTLYYEVKFSEIVCNPIDFICTYKNFYDHDDQVGGDVSECLAHLFEILDSSFIVGNSLFLCQIKKSVTCDKNHSYIYDYQCELFLELYIFNNNSTSINEWINDVFSKELNEDALCPVEDEIVPCKCNN